MCVGGYMCGMCGIHLEWLWLVHVPVPNGWYVCCICGLCLCVVSIGVVSIGVCMLCWWFIGAVCVFLCVERVVYVL